MVTTLVVSRLIAANERRIGRIGAVAGRDIAAARHAVYWAVLVSGFIEPVLYLLSLGVGVGALVGGFTLADGRHVSYAAYVAPAMLASSAMNGAFSETAQGFFSKMRYRKLYDATICTPVTPFEIAAGELLWALICGAAYSMAFLVIMTAMGLTSPLRALAALPVAILIGLAFGSLGLFIATLMHSWQDFDYLAAIIFGMFLFSGTFTPVEDYPPVLRVIVELTPLYHAVAALRALTCWSIGWEFVANLCYLVALTAAGLWIASRRVTRALCR